MNNCDFSIIIPCYNNLLLLKRALQSVLIQKKVTLEIIIVDDSPNDCISKYISQLSNPLINYYRNIPQLGAVRNWNYGLSLAKGDHIILLHHDEAFKDHFHLKTCLGYLKKDYDIVISNIEIHSAKQVKRGLCHSLLKKVFLRFPSSLFIANVIGPCACIAIKRSLQLPFNSDLCWLVDMEWYYRILKKRKILFLEELYISSMHGHEGQISQTIDVQQKKMNDLVILKKEYSKYTSFKIALLLRSIIHFLFKS